MDPVTKSDVPTGNVVYDNNEFLNCYDKIENIFDILEDPPMLEDITAYVDDIDLSKSSCVDGISTNICKDLLKHAPRYFLTIFRKSVETGTFQRKWSQGVITVIPKSGIPTNWRPITQTPIFQKRIFEKIIHNRILNYLIDNDILSVF